MRNRIVNGYKLIYKPEYINCYKKGNWKGFVYEHIFFAEKNLGRSLKEGEVVHHLDGNKLNNKLNNLIVLLRSEHGRLHCWLEKGAPYCENISENGVNCGEPKQCKVCGLTLQFKQKNFCSVECYLKHKKTITSKPNKRQLLEDLKEMPFTKVGKKYGVSDNAVRKWVRGYGYDCKAIRRQAESILSEASETTGEV